jgi:hypothetical protein
MSLSFSLQPDGPSANVAGAYTFTLTTDGACTDLPREALTRTYTATMVASSRPTRFLGTLSGARIVVSLFSPYFETRVAGDFTTTAVRFVERLSDAAYLAIDGEANASFGESGITAPFHGYFLYCPMEPAWSSGEYWVCSGGFPGAECNSSNHQLALVRR